MNPIDIIQITPDNWPAYRALRLEALQTEPQAFGSTYATNVQHPESFWRGRLEESTVGEKSWLLFAQRGDQLVGMIAAYASDDPALVDVISLYVQPLHRGQGISKQLMSAILNILRQHDQFERARLTVNPQQIAALKLYESAGFVTVGTERARMGDGNEYGERIMELRLK